MATYNSVNNRSSRVMAQVPASFQEGVRRKRRSRRPVEDIIHSAESPLEEAVYAANRIGSIEVKIDKILRMLSPEALELLRKSKPAVFKLFDS